MKKLFEWLIGDIHNWTIFCLSVLLVIVLFFLFSCKKEIKDEKRCWECNIIQKLPDTTIIINNEVHCGYNTLQIREYEKGQSINFSTVTCKEKA